MYLLCFKFESFCIILFEKRSENASLHVHLKCMCNSNYFHVHIVQFQQTDVQVLTTVLINVRMCKLSSSQRRDHLPFIVTFILKRKLIENLNKLINAHEFAHLSI